MNEMSAPTHTAATFRHGSSLVVVIDEPTSTGFLDIKGLPGLSSLEPSPAPRPLWEVKDVAAHLGLSESTIHEWVKQRKIPAYKIGGSRRFRPEEIEAFINARAESAITLEDIHG